MLGSTVPTLGGRRGVVCRWINSATAPSERYKEGSVLDSLCCLPFPYRYQPSGPTHSHSPSHTHPALIQPWLPRTPTPAAAARTAPALPPATALTTAATTAAPAPPRRTPAPPRPSRARARLAPAARTARAPRFSTGEQVNLRLITVTTVTPHPFSPR
ncbi:hypothetical protein V8E36_003283 [Tilletia maclaganii]